MWHCVGTGVARGGHAVSRQGPGSGTGRGQARGARVGTCAGTRGRECRGAAALYRAARSELQRGRRPPARGLGRPTPGRPSASLGVPGSGVPCLAPCHCIWGRGSRRPSAPTHLLPAPASGQNCGRDAQGTPLADLGSRALSKLTLVVASARPRGAYVLQILGTFISSPFIQKG